jgi:teichuronic acid biosynthesis glycosyltransferase TuaG
VPTSRDRVSVIIPAYNAAAMIRSAISHVLSQTHPVEEVFVCDDGSTDETEQAAKSFSDPRVHWVACGRNFGPGRPRNLGATLATGEWLCFLDSDDYWLPTKLEKQLEASRRSGSRLVSTNAFPCNDGVVSSKPLLPRLPHLASFESLLNDNVLVCSSVMVHRDVWARTTGFPEQAELRAVEDYACWLQCLMHTDACVLAEPLVVYNDNPSQSIRSQGVQTVWGQRAIVFEYVLDALRRQGLEDDARYGVLRRHWLRAKRKQRGVVAWLKACFRKP